MGDTDQPEQDSRRGELARRAKETAAGVGFAVSTQGMVSTFVPDGLAADLLSAGAAPVAQLAVVAGMHVAQRLLPRLGRIIGVASASTQQTPDDLIDTIRDSEAASELFARVMEAAAATRLEDKIYALGKALALGVSDPEHLDEAHMLVEALRVIEQPHAVLLGKIKDHIDAIDWPLFARGGHPDAENLGVVGRTMSAIDIENSYPTGHLSLQPVIARLTAAGLILQPGPGTYGVGAGDSGFFATEHLYAVSPMGERCLELLREAVNHPQQGDLP